MNSVVIIAAALGMRHGSDPDHLAAIDGLTRIRPRATNGVFFALGHGSVVIFLAMGTGHLMAGRLAFLGPWSLIVIGVVNLWRLLRGSSQVPRPKHLVTAQPFLLGMLLAAGFETASQLSALILAGQNNAFLVGAAFSSGMVLVDGLDGYLAASTLRLAAFGQAKAKSASRILGFIVVIFAFGLGGAELFGVELTGIALPLGLSLFIVVLGIRIWARSNRQTAELEAVHLDPSRPAPHSNPPHGESQVLRHHLNDNPLMLLFVPLERITRSWISQLSDTSGRRQHDGQSGQRTKRRLIRTPKGTTIST